MVASRAKAPAAKDEQPIHAVSESAALQAAWRRLAAQDGDRRRIARDLHDGLQGRLVLLSMQAHLLAQSEAVSGALVGELADGLDAAARILRDLVDGVVPGPLVDGGLTASVSDLAAGLPFPVDVTAGPLTGPLSEPVETTAYFVVAEALTNVVKHAHASQAVVLVQSDGEVLSVEVSDDGVGGAGFGAGSGLTGLRDRVAVLDGSLQVISASGGTRILASIPCG